MNQTDREAGLIFLFCHGEMMEADGGYGWMVGAQ